MNGKVSAIVPVYNASGYLGKCVDSILSQTYTDIEIVLVNDCSTDNSAEICQQYKFKFPDKILLIDKPRNEGVDKARFSGLTHVFGSNPEGMVTFVDSDDYIEPEAIERQVTEMIRTGADVVQMQSYRVMGMIRRKSKTFVTPQVIKQPELMEKYFISFFGVNILDVGMWAKLYKVKLIKSSGVAPTGFRMGEDLMFNAYQLLFDNRLYGLQLPDRRSHIEIQSLSVGRPQRTIITEDCHRHETLQSVRRKDHCD
ncbi:glycosyltransferase family 2 protein [Duncaniella muris]|uniref:glycosyltransferase family 2 protein n=1 Tax=Duncaniella muris TaxID=2094150 RepID=UPI0025A5B9FD|nr:glycosyltransferase family 2 protein [Duncaniella muris]